MSASPKGHITPGHVRAFQMVRTPLYDNITLANCWINGEPGVVIAMVDEVASGTFALMPLFVAITPGMDLVLEGERESDGGGGGPKHPREDFEEAAREALRPAPA